jgi:hypothetical protein
MDRFDFRLKRETVLEPSLDLAFVKDAHQVLVGSLSSLAGGHAK